MARRPPLPPPPAFLPPCTSAPRPRPCFPDPLFSRLGAPGWGFPRKEVSPCATQKGGDSRLAPRPRPPQPSPPGLRPPLRIPVPPFRPGVPQLPLPGLRRLFTRLPSHFAAAPRSPGRGWERQTRGGGETTLPPRHGESPGTLSGCVPGDPPQRQGFPGAAAGRRARPSREAARPAPPPGGPGTRWRATQPALAAGRQPRAARPQGQDLSPPAREKGTLYLAPRGGEVQTNAPGFPPPTLWGATRIASLPRATPRAPAIVSPSVQLQLQAANFLLRRRRRVVERGDRVAGGGEGRSRGGSERRGKGSRAVKGLPESRVSADEAGLPVQACAPARQPQPNGRALHVLGSGDAPSPSTRPARSRP